MDLRTQSTLTLSGFHYISYVTYGKALKNVLTVFELLVTKISLHGPRQVAAFMAHEKGQKGDKLALLGRWRSPETVAHHLSNVKASFTALKLENNTHRKRWQAEYGFFKYLSSSRLAVETFDAYIPSSTSAGEASSSPAKQPTNVHTKPAI